MIVREFALAPDAHDLHRARSLRPGWTERRAGLRWAMTAARDLLPLSVHGHADLADDACPMLVPPAPVVAPATMSRDLVHGARSIFAGCRAQ
jgi:hypothetical protein